MAISVRTRFENDSDLPDDAAHALALAAHVLALADVFKASGMTVDEAVERVGNALRTAWQD